MTTAFFVAADWLAEHIDDPEIQILDARMAPPGQEHRDMAGEYRAGHIPGALFFDIEALSDRASPLPHMMPRPEAFAVAMRELGVRQDKHLVIYDEGNLFSAPRAWWMLRTFGAEKVSILAGGLAGWQRDEWLLREGEEAHEEGECIDSLEVRKKTGRTLDYSGSDGIRFGGACKPVAQILVVNQ